ncbi:ATP/GTP-binding protein [Spirosoma jeollabukense]
MGDFINYIEISNFKSIRHLELTDFKKINLFIGRPNVGKSNLLEALSLFSLPYIWENSPRKLTEIIRLENQREIFHEGNISNEVLIRAGKDRQTLENCYVNFNFETGGLDVDISFTHVNGYLSTPQMPYRAFFRVDEKFRLDYRTKLNEINFVDYIKRYTFNTDVKYKENKTPFLYPPFGINLLYILELMPELRQFYAQWFRQYGLRLVLDTASQSVKIQKDKGDEVFQLPYSSVADTLQRIIFYKTAVASNKNSVLLFEEPEAHAYPPYITEFTQEVIKSETNQFFIVTHSPLIVNDFLEGAINDLAIFMVDFKDGQTITKPLTREEIKEVYQYGVDLFFNNESYLS